MQVNPLHHTALEAHCCLASACRVAARRHHKLPTTGEIEAEIGAAGAGLQAVGGPAEAAGVAANVALRAAAAAHALVLAAALQRLVSAGERHAEAFRHAGLLEDEVLTSLSMDMCLLLHNGCPESVCCRLQRRRVWLVPDVCR